MLQRTVFINKNQDATTNIFINKSECYNEQFLSIKIRMLQRTKMLQRTRRNIIGRRNTHMRMTCPAFFKKLDNRPPTYEPPTVLAPEMSRNDNPSPSTSVIFYDFFITESLFIFSLGKIVCAFHVRYIVYAFY
jgi:hypothetical protein